MRRSFSRLVGLCLIVAPLVEVSAVWAVDHAVEASSRRVITHEEGDGPVAMGDMETRVDHASWTGRPPGSDSTRVLVCIQYAVGMIEDSTQFAEKYSGVTVKGTVVGIDADGNETTLVRNVRFKIRKGFGFKCPEIVPRDLDGIVSVVFRSTLRRNKDVAGLYFCDMTLFKPGEPQAAPVPRPRNVWRFLQAEERRASTDEGVPARI